MMGVSDKDRVWPKFYSPLSFILLRVYHEPVYPLLFPYYDAYFSCVLTPRPFLPPLLPLPYQP